MYIHVHIAVIYTKRNFVKYRGNCFLDIKLFGFKGFEMKSFKKKNWLYLYYCGANVASFIIYV